MPTFDVTNGEAGDASFFNQFSDTLTGNNDTDYVAYTQIIAPSALTATVNATTGNLTGNYQYKVAFITGYWEGPTGSGTLHTKGNTSGGTTSATVSPSAEQVDLSSIPIGGTGVVARYIYRTTAGGSTFYLLQEVNDNTTTSWTDNIADVNLGAAMPTANTTGGKFSGDGSGLTGITSSQVGAVSTSEIGAAGGVASLDSTGNVPTAQLGNVPPITSSAVETALGFTPLSTTGTAADSSELGGLPATDYLRTDSGAPDPQVIANRVNFLGDLTLAPSSTAANSTAAWLKSNYYDSSATERAFAWITGSPVAYSPDSISLWWGSSPSSIGNLLFEIDKSGNVQFANNMTATGTVTSSSGQLGSASGTWTPASGTFNVVAGTVINIRSVPSGAKMFYTNISAGGIASTLQAQWGTTTSSGSIFHSAYGYSGSSSVQPGFANGISGSVSSGAVTLSDATYETSGYYQINNGYLQFVTTTSAITPGQGQATIQWAVS